jgi:anti-sigma regulatory factor (Ser/Thr protein kinase)
MTNKAKIQQLIQERGRITTSEISELLGVSRQYANIVISDLIAENEVVKIGSTRSAFYVSHGYIKNNPDTLPTVFKKTYKNESLEEHKVLMEIEEKFPKLAELPENVKSIFVFAFSEMFNNAIEHSQSKTISIEVAIRNGQVSFIVTDSGVGAFRNIMNKKSLKSELEAIQDLLKGKTTTMPKSHSGEGIFFTSKSADLFLLDSFDYELSINAIKPNISIHHLPIKKRGTKVTFSINTDSDRHLNDVFKRYTNLTDKSDYGFDKTEIRVKLFTTGGIHVSRSQARRVLSGLEKFKIVMFDYDQVPMVGQAFADEIYRVFKNSHPNIVLQNENMNEGVKFMVERSMHEAGK